MAIGCAVSLDKNRRATAGAWTTNMPVVSEARKLNPAGRRFLAFMSFNVVSWQVLVGPTLVLFARHIDMPRDKVGLLLSCLPFSAVLIVFTIRWVEWFGPRRCLMWGWRASLAIASLALLMPLALAWWGPAAGWRLLLIATLGFCVCRSLGVGGWLPWLHEQIPSEQRGRYFSCEMSVVHCCAIAVSLLCAAALAGTPTLARFLGLYVVAIVAGWISVFMILKIPGGEKATMPETLTGLAAYRAAARDREFMRYLLQAAVGLVFLSALSASMVLYLRDALGYSSGHIMLMMATSSVLTMLVIRYWGEYADHKGSKRALILSMAAHVVVALGWLLLWPGSAWTPALAWALVICGPVFISAFSIAAVRGMLCHTKREGRMGYTNLWTACTALGQGLVTVLVGVVIEAWEFRGFQVCFAASTIGGLVSAIGFFRLSDEEGRPPAPYLTSLIRPSLPLRTMARITWITLGIESRKNGKGR